MQQFGGGLLGGPDGKGFQLIVLLLICTVYRAMVALRFFFSRLTFLLFLLGYSNHKCNAFFEEDASVTLKKDQLQRFQFYSERYNNHTNSQKHTKKAMLYADAVVDKVCCVSSFSIC